MTTSTEGTAGAHTRTCVFPSCWYSAPTGKRRTDGREGPTVCELRSSRVVDLSRVLSALSAMAPLSASLRALPPFLHNQCPPAVELRGYFRPKIPAMLRPSDRNTPSIPCVARCFNEPWWIGQSSDGTESPSLKYSV